VPNFVKIDPTAAEIWLFLDFSKMAVVCHLGFVKREWGPPTKGISWSLSLCKIGIDVEYFDNMHVFRFREFGLKTPIHPPKLGVWVVFDPLNGEQCEKFPKRHILA